MSDTREATTLLAIKHDTADAVCKRSRRKFYDECGPSKNKPAQATVLAVELGALQLRYDELLRDFNRVRDLLAAEPGEE